MFDVIANAAGAIGDRVVVGLIVSGITAVVMGAGAIAVMKVMLKAVVQRTEKLENADGQQDKQIAAVREDRQRCKADARGLYVSKETFGTVLKELRDGQEGIHKRIDEVDHKVGDLKADLAELRGELKGREPPVQT